jgi:heptose-I-phosphate ethanolaminephosphotransferase
MAGLAGVTAYLTLVPALLLMHHMDGLYLLRMAMVSVYNIVLTLSIFSLISTIDSGYSRILVHIPVIGYIIIYAFALFYHVLAYDQMLGVPAIGAVVDLNRKEAFEYVQTFFNFRTLALALVLSAPVAWAFTRRCEPIDMPRRARLSLLSLVVILPIVGLSKEFVARNSLFLLVWQGTYEVVSAKLEVAHVVNQFHDIPRGRISNADARARVHVLVLGETTTSRHMSLYGYPRQTNPLLESARDKLFIAKDVCSSRGATAPALKELLSFANREDGGVLFTAPNLIEVMKAAGYKTFWISNQQNTGFLATWAAIFASSADVGVFVNSQGGTDDVSHLDTRSYDEKLFEPLDAALADTAESKFILLHLMGSHAAYELRYPETYAKFSAEKQKTTDEPKLSLIDFWRKNPSTSTRMTIAFCITITSFMASSNAWTRSAAIR